MGRSTRARRGAEHERPVCAAVSGRGVSYKPKAKSSAAQRESEGIVVPAMAAKNNAAGGKGPCGGRADGAGKREGMAGKTGPNHPGGRGPRDKVRQLQRRLWAAAKRSPGRRFHALYDRIWRGDVLWEAWKRVRRNSGAAGVDRPDDPRRRAVRRRALPRRARGRAARRRVPAEAVLRRYIPKADGRKRPLGIPTVRDRVVQMAAKLVLEPIFEADFLPCSYGFRPKRSATLALETLREARRQGRQPRARRRHPRLLRQHRPREADEARGATRLGSAGAQAAAAVARGRRDGGGHRALGRWLARRRAG